MEEVAKAKRNYDWTVESAPKPQIANAKLDPRTELDIRDARETLSNAVEKANRVVSESWRNALGGGQ
jgi:hypothetical protein